MNKARLALIAAVASFAVAAPATASAQAPTPAATATSVQAIQAEMSVVGVQLKAKTTQLRSIERSLDELGLTAAKTTDRAFARQLALLITSLENAERTLSSEIQALAERLDHLHNLMDEIMKAHHDATKKAIGSIR
jgi:hypothetical protein